MMRCKAVRIFSLLLLVLLVSCRVETPKNILSQGKMGEVLYDYHLARALIDKEHYAGYYKEKLVYRAVFEKHGVFSPAMIDGIIRKLRSYKDRTLRADIGDDREQMLALVHKYFHCG
jgi:hypothetical protein